MGRRTEGFIDIAICQLLQRCIVGERRAGPAMHMQQPSV